VVRHYVPLSKEEGLIAAKLASEGVSQQHIALKLHIAKQSVATYLKRHGLGKRRPWSPTGKVVRVNADGWQLTVVATFEHFATREICGNVYCFSHFHVVKNHTLAYEEAIADGQATCNGDVTYMDDKENELWIPIYVYKETWIRWKPRE